MGVLGQSNNYFRFDPGPPGLMPFHQYLNLALETIITKGKSPVHRRTDILKPE